MSNVNNTPLSSQYEILAEFWIDYKNDEDFEDFAQYNDLGLPLAYAIANGIVDPTEVADRFVGETWDLFINGMGLEDTGFETLDEIMSLALKDD